AVSICADRRLVSQRRVLVDGALGRAALLSRNLYRDPAGGRSHAALMVRTPPWQAMVRGNIIAAFCADHYPGLAGDPRIDLRIPGGQYYREDPSRLPYRDPHPTSGVFQFVSGLWANAGPQGAALRGRPRR